VGGAGVGVGRGRMPMVMMVMERRLMSETGRVGSLYPRRAGGLLSVGELSRLGGRIDPARRRRGDISLWRRDARDGRTATNVSPDAGYPG
jgi:hypothetical protein